MSKTRTSRLSTLSLTLAVAACSLACQAVEESAVEESAVAEQELYKPNNVGKWPTPQIPVCWSQEAANETDFAQFRNRVRVWLAEGWSAAANVEFTDWGVCSPFPSNNHINVYFVDNDNSAATPGYSGSPGDTHQIGGVTYVRQSGRNGLQFNRNDARSAQARATVLHEFGHSLGYSHEQDRGAVNCQPVDPAACPNGDCAGTQYDLNSVMNYSYCHWLNDGLTSSDMRGMNRIYGGFPDTKLVTARRSDGRIDLVYNGTGNVLYRITQDAPNAGWARPSLLVPETPTVRAKQMATGANADGRLEVFFAGTDDRLRHTYQYSDGRWSPEFYLAGSDTFARQLAVSSYADKRLAVFFTGTDNVVRHINQLSTGGWSGVGALGDGVTTAKRLAIGQNLDGRLEVFLTGTDDVLRHIYYTGSSWSGTYNLANAWSKAKEIAVGRNTDGRLEVFYVGTDDVLRHIFQLTGGGWSGEETLGSTTAKQIAVGQDADGRLEVIFTGTDDGLRRIYQQVGGSWSGVEWLINSSAKAKQLTVGRNQDGRLEVFYYGTNNTLYHTYQSTAGSAFGGEYHML